MVKSFARIFAIVKRYRGRFFLSQIMMFIAALATVGYSTLITPLVNEGMVAGNADEALRIGIWMLLLAVVMGVAMSIAASQAVFFSQGTGYVVRRYLYEKIQNYSFENYDHMPTGKLMVRLNADVVNIQNAMQYAIMLGSYAPFMLLATIILAIARTPDLLWVLLIVVVAVLVLMAILIPAIAKAYKKRQEELDALNNTLQENLTGISVVKAFTREQYEIEKFSKNAADIRHPAYAAAWRVAFLSPLLTGVGQLSIILATWAGGSAVLSGTGMTVGQVSTFNSYMSLIIAPLALMSIVLPLVLRGDVSAERILEAFDAEPTVLDKEGVEPKESEEIEGKIRFENVSFAFRRADGEFDPPALKNINLTIEPGQKVGFLGATGSGKSALVNLIPRFYDVTEGRITIDGIDVREFPQDNLREIVGIALQEAVLFQGDLRFNLKYGDPQAEDDVMFDAAKAADSWGFINNLPEKWEAPVSRRGYNFSGGQRQRLSINRALTAQPKVIILDDSTSALDASTEGRVQEAIPEFMHGATTIYVAQRISAVIDLDHIYLLENGEIIAEGNHEELLQSSPLYQEIYESQLGGGVTAGLELEEVAA
jgi:ABC-type multidrug transport system fused ATPase/permease subunit